MQGFIYQIINNVNGQCYIGQTTSSVEKRFRCHLSPSSNCKYLKNAIEKYGREAFSAITLHGVYASNKNELLEILERLEKQEIERFNSLAPDGYNILSGGRNSYRKSVPRKKKWKRTPASVERSAKSKTGKKHPKRSHKQRQRNAETHWKPVICNQTGQTWTSVKECAAFFGVKPKQISRILKGQRKKLKWQFSFSYLASNLNGSKPKEVTNE